MISWSKVWYEVVFWVLIHVFLKLMVSSGLSLQAFWEVGTVASWDRLFLGELSSSFLEIVLCCDDVMINSEVWNEVVFVVLVHVSLKFLIGSSLSLQAFWEVS
jgi:hypothetical protein